MKIAKVDSISVKIPFTLGGAPTGYGGRNWTTNNILLIRVETDTGITGWGEAFCYGCTDAVRAALQSMVAPIVIGRDARDIAKLSYELQQALHLFGRYGITIFALSGLDIALWDIAGKAANLPLHRLLGGAGQVSLPAYASLLKYRDPERVAARTRQAIDEGYKYIKLHETEEAEVRAARDAAGNVPIMVDTNCPWTVPQAIAMARRLAPLDLHWLEEPVWPPENVGGLADVRIQGGIDTAAGENYGTVWDFRRAFEAGAITYAQPSVTKIGGVTEMRRVIALAELFGVTVVPHSAYFGPGLLASIHCIAALASTALVERFYCDFEDNPLGDAIHPRDGHIAVPQGPGLGVDPDPRVLDTLRTG